MLVCGRIGGPERRADPVLAVYAQAGDADTRFGNGGILYGTLNRPGDLFRTSDAWDLAFTPDGKLVMAGSEAVARLDPATGALITV